MSEQLEQIKTEYIAKLKQLKLIEAGVDVDKAEQYVKYITAEKEADIAAQAADVAADLTKKPGYVDPHVASSAGKSGAWNPFD